MADVELALSEEVANRLFQQLRDKFSASHSDSGRFGSFTAAYSVGAKLKNGRIEFQSNGTVLIKELDIVYDPLKLTIGIDIPSVTIGGFCIIPGPFGCFLRAPRKTFFGGNPDVSLPIDLSGIVTTEISGSCNAQFRHLVNPGAGGLTPWQAHAAGKSNEWQLFMDPGYIDIDLIDIADSVGNLVDKLIDAFVNKLLGFLPGWARDLVSKILGSLSDLIRTILDIGDDIQEWLSNLLGVSLGLFDFIVQMVLEYFANKTPLFAFTDPYPLLPAEQGPTPSLPLVAVLMPVLTPSVSINDNELAISASFGSL